MPLHRDSSTLRGPPVLTTMRVRVQAGSPMRRTGTPEDVADAILGLVRSGYVTGPVLLVDGGLSLVPSPVTHPR